MKPVSLCSAVMLFVLCSHALAAETGALAVYTVPGNTRGNEFTLTMANSSPSLSAEMIAVTPVHHSRAITFTTARQTIKLLAPQKENDLTFLFDVGREAKAGSKDTVVFQAMDKAGIIWSKSVVFAYAGPTVYSLEQNYPNPFNPRTVIRYQLPEDSKITLTVYDIVGREVIRLIDGVEQAGYLDTQFDARRSASGVYFCRMVASSVAGGRTYIKTIKMMVLK
jgi:hypothetical protein